MHSAVLVLGPSFFSLPQFSQSVAGAVRANISPAHAHALTHSRTRARLLPAYSGEIVITSDQTEGEIPKLNLETFLFHVM